MWTMKSLEGSVMSRGGTSLMFGSCKAIKGNVFEHVEETEEKTAAIKEYLGNGKTIGADHAIGVCVGDDLGV